MCTSAVLLVELVDGVRVRIGLARRWTCWNGSSDDTDRRILDSRAFKE